MSKAMSDAGADAALTYWTDATAMKLCTAQPTTYAEANATYAVATIAPTFDAIADGDTSGRKRGIQAKTAVPVTVSGTVNHCVLVKTADSTLRYVTTTTPQAVVSGGTADIGAWKIELADPT